MFTRKVYIERATQSFLVHDPFNIIFPKLQIVFNIDIFMSSKRWVVNTPFLYWSSNVEHLPIVVISGPWKAIKCQGEGYLWKEMSKQFRILTGYLTIKTNKYPQWCTVYNSFKFSIYNTVTYHSINTHTHYCIMVACREGLVQSYRVKTLHLRTHCALRYRALELYGLLHQRNNLHAQLFDNRQGDWNCQQFLS